MTEPTTVEILRAARALIATPEQWTQGTPARGQDGWPVWPESPDARQWCAIGACVAAGSDDERWMMRAIDALEAVALEGSVSAARFNDSHRHADVLALYDRAIALAEQEAMAA